MIKRCLSVFIIFAFVFENIIQAQNDSLRPNNYGLFFHYGLNQHYADFNKLSGIPNCCPNFQNGTGFGMSVGLLFDKYIIKDISASIRLSFASFNGDMKTNEETFVIVEGIMQPGEFTHKMTGEFSNIGIEPLINYNPFAGLFLHLGVRGAYQIIKNFDQLEQITKPSDIGTFADSFGNDTYSRFRNDIDGEIPNSSSIMLYGVIGLSYELPLNSDKTLTLSPEIFYYLGLNSNVSDVPWNINSLRGGLAIKYSPKERIEKIETLEKIDTVFIESEFVTSKTFKEGIPTMNESENIVEDVMIITQLYSRTDTIFTPKKYNITASITAVGVDSAGNEIQNPKIVIEEFISNRYQPLLNYIFFNENSSGLKETYNQLNKNQLDSFDIQKLHKKETLETYYEILNIVGKRMLKYPNANLRIVGCNADIKDEKGNLKLSENRAEAVKEYLRDVWKIDSKRLRIEVKNNPSKPSTPIDDPEKIAENRRVELYSEVPEILEPVYTTDTINIAKPSILRFYPEVSTDAGLKSWSISAYQNIQKNKINYDSSGNTLLPKNVDWGISENQKNVPKYQDPIDYFLKVEDVKGNTFTTDIAFIPVELITIQKKRYERLGDKIIERFSLVLFDFDDATIKDNNKNIVEFIKSKVSPNSIITISGYSDRTGDDIYNKDLAIKRANTTKTAIGRNDARVFGIGEDNLLYNNDLPEGRFYCRTVNVLVETPIK